MQAIQAVLGAINAEKDPKPLPLIMQLGFYIFLNGNPAAAASFLERILPDYPDNAELLRNLATMHSRSGNHQRALDLLKTLTPQTPQNPYLYDTLTNCYHKLGYLEKASEAGTTALMLKDQAQNNSDSTWKLPSQGPAVWAQDKTAIVSFSLWGRNPRYLRGALDNALAMGRIYRGWKARYYVDDSVPTELLDVLIQLGCEVRVEERGQPDRQKLAWRFGVANDPTVGYFLVRDVDSVISLRESSAVQNWLESGKWFHIMRDWWTHTDLMLAGMWGGVSGVLPNLQMMMMDYKPPFMETPNIDQWFLRDRVWQYVRGHCLVHDRCFMMPGSQPWPMTSPPGNEHVGQDVFSAGQQAQALRLKEWIHSLPCLQLAN